MLNIIFYLSLLFSILRFNTNFLNLLLDFASYLLPSNRTSPPYRSPLDLPTIRFKDLLNRWNRSVDEMCFICFADYEPDDVVSHLGRCGHVFHYDCAGEFLHRNRLDCPICRSPIFTGLPSVGIIRKFCTAPSCGGRFC